MLGDERVLGEAKGHPEDRISDLRYPGTTGIPVCPQPPTPPGTGRIVDLILGCKPDSGFGLSGLGWHWRLPISSLPLPGRRCPGSSWLASRTISCDRTGPWGPWPQGPGFKPALLPSLCPLWLSARSFPGCPVAHALHAP